VLTIVLYRVKVVGMPVVLTVGPQVEGVAARTSPFGKAKTNCLKKNQDLKMHSRDGTKYPESSRPATNLNESIISFR
jgi:hypothetical protein